MASAHDIIARCTRDGVTAWQHVAAQLGCSMDAARRGYDPNYMNARPWPVLCVEITQEGEIIDENDTHSLAPKGPGMRMDIACLLKRHGSLPVEAIAGRLNRPRNSVRMRLSQMHAKGWVENDSRGRANGVIEWTWRLTDKGMALAVTGCAEDLRRTA